MDVEYPDKNAEWVDSIVVFDLDDHEATPRVSDIQCPTEAYPGVNAILMTDKQHDEVLAWGYMRGLCRSTTMHGEGILPRDITMLVTQWVETEWVYLLHWEGEGLWKLRLDEILESVI